MLNCPCESGKPYSQCCEVYHLGAPAPTAEALMRSRYSAYALATQNPALREYLLQTWHPQTRPQSLDLYGENASKWLGLQIRHHHNIDAEHATVEFVARYKHAGNLGGKTERLHETSRFKRHAGNLGGKTERLHETSRFQRIDHRWYYVDGDYQ